MVGGGGPALLAREQAAKYIVSCYMYPRVSILIELAMHMHDGLGVLTDHSRY
jgi:hypothetical protein